MVFLTLLTLVFSQTNLLLAASEALSAPATDDASASILPQAESEPIADPAAAELSLNQALPGGAILNPNLPARDPGEGEIEQNLYYNKNQTPTLNKQLNVDADVLSGAFVYNLPLAIPPGRNGLEPSLSLSYNSQAVDNQSLFGYGWFVNLPSIARQNKKGLNRLYQENYFISSLSGELGPIELADEHHGLYGAKTELGDFLRYEYAADDFWTVTDKQGTIYRFGLTAASRQDDPDDDSKIFKWLLEEIRDANDNFVKYEYEKNNGQIYPLRITYTGHGQTDGIFSLEFLREQRPDQLVSYSMGFAARTVERINEILLKQAGQWFKKYQLAYRVGDNAARSILVSITESARDSQGNVLTLPANEFSYSVGNRSWQADEDLEIPIDFIYSNRDGFTPDRGARLIDINGDGLVDILNDVTVYLNDGHNWQLDENFQLPLSFLGNAPGTENGLRLGDVNGDSLPDLIKSGYTGPEGQLVTAVYLNRGHGAPAWELDENYQIPLSFTIAGGANRDRGVQLADVNADGLDDILCASDNSQGNGCSTVYLNRGDGSGWLASQTFQFPAPFIVINQAGADRYLRTDGGLRLADVNADGLPDLIHALFGQPARVYLNNGSNWLEDENWEVPLPFVQGQPENYSNGVEIMDINADGLVDLARANADEAIVFYLNRGDGSGWELTDQYQLPENFRFNRFGDDLDSGVRLGDANADGLVDFLWSITRDLGGDQPAVNKEVYLAQGQQADRLLNIRHSQGAVTEVAYKSSQQYFDDQGLLLNPKLPFILQTVERLTVNDGLANQTVTSYKYYEGENYFNGPLDRKFTGFGRVEKASGSSKTVFYFHQGNETNELLGETSDSIYKNGKIYRQESWQLAGENEALLSQQVNQWQAEDLGQSRQFVYLDTGLDYSFNTEEGGQRQMMAVRPGRELNGGLNQAQLFSPQVEPQLIQALSTNSASYYFLGYDQSGRAKYRAIIYNDLNQDNGLARDNGEVEEYLGDNRDGYFVKNAENDLNWVQLLDSARANEVRNGVGDNYQSLVLSANDTYALTRIFFLFNTANLPAEANIYNAALNFEVFANRNLGWVYLVGFNPQNPENITVDDFSRIDNVNRGSVHLGQINQPVRREISLNELGRALISTDGFTSLALKSAFDYGHNYGEGSVNITPSETDGVEQDPYLTVEYTLDPPPTATDLQVNGQVNPDDLTNEQLTFSAIYHNDDEEERAVGYQLQLLRAGGSWQQPLWDSGYRDLAAPVANGERSEEINYDGNDLNLDGWQYFWRLRFYNDGDQGSAQGLWSAGQDYFYVDGSLPPSAPADLKTNNLTDPFNVFNRQLIFSAIYHDPNPVDFAKWYCLQIDDQQDFSSLLWDSQKSEFNGLLANGLRSEAIQYAGEDLPYSGQTYYWRLKFWDDEGEAGIEGEWSAPGQFTMFNGNDVLDNAQVKAVKYHYDFTNGNLSQEENLGSVLAADNGLYLNNRELVAGDETAAAYEYAEPVEQSSYILSSPKAKTMVKPSTNELTVVEVYYDGLAYGLVTKANPTKEDLNLPQTVYEKTFNDYGLITQIKDPLNHRTNVVYDNNNYYPSRTTNHLNQAVLTEYDLATGQIKRTTDPNGVIEERDYDVFGRLTQVRKTSPASGNLLVMQNYEYHDADNPFWTRQVNYPGQSFEQNIYTYFDGLGRTIQTREQSEIVNQFRVTSIAYDDKGNLAKQSLVYFANNSFYTEPDWDTPRTEYTYDAQNRVLSEEFIGDQNHRYLTSYKYDGWNVLVTDPNGNWKKLYRDAYGQLIQVDEYLANEVYATNYEYNLLGKITKITDSLGNERNFTYDSLGRLLSQEEMHQANTPEEDINIWAMEYDSASNLINTIDPKGQVIRYAYDGLNRILTEDFQGQNGTEVTYTYDSGSYGKGRLYRVVSEGAAITYTYDKWGRVTKEAKTINGRLYNTQWAYNLQSTPTSITYPDNSKIYYSYNRLALPITVRTAEPGQSIVDSLPLINAVLYSPLKQIQEIRYNSGIVSTNTFDPVQAYRLTQKRTVNPFNSVIQDLSYSYDNSGNISQLIDQSQTSLAKNTAYQYDDLYRLTNTTVTNSANQQDYQQSYEYDIIGNILNKSDIGDYEYGNFNPYQASGIADADYTYDLNGNLTNDGVKAYHYNWADRLTSVNIDEDNVLYNNYDQAGLRTVKQLNKTIPNTQGGESTLITRTTYPNSLYEEEISGLEGEEQDWQTIKTRHITLGNQTIAHFTVNSQGNIEQALVFGDHLGSASLLTDAFGRPKVLYDYYPFGGSRMEQQVGGGMRVAAYQYTGKENDKEIGLYNYGARYYEAASGRFTQSDPVSLKIAMSDEVKKVTGQSQQQLLANPQILNSYAYTSNNPVKYVDPDGKFLWAIIPLVISGSLFYGANIAYSPGTDFQSPQKQVTKDFGDVVPGWNKIPKIGRLGLGLMFGGLQGKLSNTIASRLATKLDSELATSLTKRAENGFINLYRAVDSGEFERIMEKGISLSKYVTTDISEALSYLVNKGAEGRLIQFSVPIEKFTKMVTSSGLVRGTLGEEFTVISNEARTILNNYILGK